MKIAVLRKGRANSKVMRAAAHWRTLCPQIEAASHKWEAAKSNGEKQRVRENINDEQPDPILHELPDE